VFVCDTFIAYLLTCHLLGRHTVEILHNGQAIMGSPFFVEIYDPNKIRIEGTRMGTVNERMEFDSQCSCCLFNLNI